MYTSKEEGLERVKMAKEDAIERQQAVLEKANPHEMLQRLAGNIDEEGGISHKDRVSALVPRPLEILAAIDKSFRKLLTQTGWDTGYTQTGSEGYSMGGCSTSDVIPAFLEEPHDSPVQILDVGTGSGLFLQSTKEKFGEQVDVHGLTAHDMRHGHYPRDIDYRVGNAERLLEMKDSESSEFIFPPNSLDLIVSRDAVKHFVDPLGAIVQMYEALKPNGIMVIDSFSLAGIDDALPSIIQYLQKQGYQIAAGYNYGIGNPDNQLHVAEFNSLFIRKTEPHLNLPIEYNGVTEEIEFIPEAKYVITDEVDVEPLSLSENIREYIEIAREINPGANRGDFFADEIIFLRRQGNAPVFMSMLAEAPSMIDMAMAVSYQ